MMMTAGFLNRQLDADPAHCVTLTRGIHSLRIAPGAGGRILSWRSQLPDGPRDWLVPIELTGWPAHTWPKGGMFPLAPFSNRVRDGQLHWQGKVIALEPQPEQPHALHGQAQAMPWTLTAAQSDQATLTLLHSADVGGWPWQWQADQVIRLRDNGLAVTLTLRNTDTQAMPAGLGLHPYFTARQVELSATTDWVIEDDMARYAQPNRQSVWTRGTSTWTSYLSGWTRTARILWDEGPGLTLQASSALDQIVLHCNEGRYVCAEPVTHVCDAFNLAQRGVAGTGARTLASGQALSVSIELTIESPAH